jgi:hypothetical protein
MMTQDTFAPTTAAVKPHCHQPTPDPDLPIEATGGTSNSNGQVQVDTPPPVCAS